MRRRLLLAAANFWILFFLLGLVLYFTITTPNHAFFQTSNFKSIALDTSEVILLGIGETFVIVTAGIDLSVGGILVFSGVAGGLVMLHFSGTTAQTSALQYPHAGTAVPLGVAVALLAGVAWGLLNGLLITRLRLPPFIVTLGTLGMSFGGADLLTGGTNLSSVPTNFQNSVGNGSILGLYVPVIIALIAVVVAQVVLTQTRFGRYTAAIGSNADGSLRSGVNVDRHLVKVYVLTGFLCGLAGVLDLARFGTENLSAHNIDNLNAIAAVVIGGTSLFGGVGTIIGTLIGAFIPTVLQNGFVINQVDPFWQEVLVGATIIVAVYLDQWRRRRSSN
ncbi:MAG: ABC transporter permease [Chloroflexi bacterium]|nr:MAG: ABC transporter permease [Chloroflexota bacterium]